VTYYYDPRIGKLFRMTGFRVLLHDEVFIFHNDMHRIITQVRGYKQAMAFAKGVQAGRKYPPFEFKSEYMCEPFKPSTEKETP
jgi:hypothetical protein